MLQNRQFREEQCYNCEKQGTHIAMTCWNKTRQYRTKAGMQRHLRGRRVVTAKWGTRYRDEVYEQQTTNKSL